MNEVSLIIITAGERDIAPIVGVLLHRFENFLKTNNARERFGTDTDARLKTAFELARAQADILGEAHHAEAPLRSDDAFGQQFHGAIRFKLHVSREHDFRLAYAFGKRTHAVQAFFQFAREIALYRLRAENTVGQLVQGHTQKRKRAARLETDGKEPHTSGRRNTNVLPHLPDHQHAWLPFDNAVRMKAFKAIGEIKNNFYAAVGKNFFLGRARGREWRFELPKSFNVSLQKRRRRLFEIGHAEKKR